MREFKSSRYKFSTDIKISTEEKPLGIAMRLLVTFKSRFESRLEARLHLAEALRRLESRSGMYGILLRRIAVRR